ncbi:NFACT family protein [Oscillospiraceae bacterium CM]|nr:NFACT family protein [Oscillospiraceae bacterium CM]
MPLDAFCLTALCSELAHAVTGLKIDKVQQPERDQILLTLRGYGAPRRLLISAGAQDARVHLTEYSFENPSAPPMFCMLLRKHLAGAKIVSLTQAPLERVVDLRVDAPDALGEAVEKHLILELIGRHSNIILTTGDGLIIDCLRRVDGVMSPVRPVLPGLYYSLPPTQDKRDPLSMTRDAFFAAFKASPPEKEADVWLVQTFHGLSPLVARELVNRSYGETDKRLGAVTDWDGGKLLFASFAALTAAIAAGHFTPVLVVGRDGRMLEFSYTAISQYGDVATMRQMAGFSELLETFYTRRSQAERLTRRAQTLHKTAATAYERLVRKLALQREELKKTEGRERLRELGDLITANLYAVQKGDESVTVVDFYAPDGRTVNIPLDPRKTPQQNAARYYRDYQKAKNAEKVLTGQIVQGDTELLYLKTVLDELKRAASERELQEIRRELVLTGYIKREKTNKKEKTTALPPMKFKSSSGLDIFVGRNNVQNEALTHALAFKSDVWLHAQKIPGSHVVISTHGAVPDAQTLSEAASLAAWFSQGRGGGKIPVDYTLVKHVKKMPGARPGMVTYTDYQTIIAIQQEDIAERLK